MEKFKIFLLLIFVKVVESKFYTSDTILKNLIAYDSATIKQYHEKHQDFHSESFYFSPYETFASNMNFTENKNSNKAQIRKARADTTFRGKPKTTKEVWARNFNFSSQQYSQSTSLVTLLNKIVIKYMGDCIPVILYDNFVEKSEGFILQRLFEEFPTTFIHGRIGHNFTLEEKILLKPPDPLRCRSYIVFISDALQTRKVIGPQIDNRVIVVPRSTQWKLQEFLSSPISRDIINLLVIGESYSADKIKERPYVLYTHELYVDGLGSNRPKVLTSWLKGRLSRPHINLFPTKLRKGFAGHRFSVAAAHFPPFVFKILKTDGVGNVQIRWDGYEYRILKILGQKLNFTFDIGEPKNLIHYGPGDAVGESILKRQFDIGIAGMYATTERNTGMEMSISHDTDCAAFITLTSKALPRYRAILGPFQWQVWVCLTFVYLIAIIPLAYSDALSLRILIEKPGEIENMFWYVFGTFTNSLTFTGESSWSNSKKTSTRLLIGFYWLFTIIITACYTGSIIAFVTLPVFPETVDKIEQLRNGFYRIGTLDRGGWERWFTNSTEKETARLLKNLEFVKDIQEGIGNVTKTFFLFPYAFIYSRQSLDYVVKTNYTDDKMLSRRSALHISDQCFALFGVSLAFQQESVYRQKINEALMMMQQAGFVEKIKNDVRWDMLRTSSGAYLQVSSGKTLKMTNQEERGLTLADTEGMFLLLGIGFLIAAGVLISEWVGGCGKKCLQIVRIRKQQKREEHRLAEEAKQEEENTRIETEHLARQALTSATSVIGVSVQPESGLEETSKKEDVEIGSSSQRSSKHSRSSSISNIADLNSAMLAEMFAGPKNQLSNIVFCDGKMMNEHEAVKFASDNKEKEERMHSGSSEVSKTFQFLNNEEADDDRQMELDRQKVVCEVEINVQIPLNDEKEIEEIFGEKIKNGQ